MNCSCIHSFTVYFAMVLILDYAVIIKGSELLFPDLGFSFTIPLSHHELN